MLLKENLEIGLSFSCLSFFGSVNYLATELLPLQKIRSARQHSVVILAVYKCSFLIFTLLNTSLPNHNKKYIFYIHVCLFKSKGLLGWMSPKFVPLDSYIPPVLLGIKDSTSNVKQTCNVNTNLKHFINRHDCQKSRVQLLVLLFLAQFQGWSLWDTSTKKMFYLWLKASTVNGLKWKEPLSYSPFGTLVLACCTQAVVIRPAKRKRKTDVAYKST